MSIANGLALPNPLSNGTTADAVPVMADFNYLLNALNRALLDAGGGSGMNAQNTQIHNLSSGSSANDAVNLSQLGAYLPLTGGALSGGLTGTTLGLSGLATLAAVTASGLITANGGVNTTTLNASGLAGFGSYVTLTANGTALQFTDLSGTHPYFSCQNDNDFVFSSTDASGNPRTIWNIFQRSSTSAFNINPAVTMGSTLSVAGELTGGSGILSSGFMNIDSAQPMGFSHTRVGQVGYHMYNGGAIAEWVFYQPAHATDDKLHIGQMAAGAITDRLVIDTAGAISAGALSLSSTLAVTGASTLAAISGTTLNLSGTATLAGVTATGALSLTGALSTGSAANSVGYLGAPQNLQTANYTLALSDMAKSVDMNGANLTLTVPANASVAFPVGAVIVGTNLSSTNLTIAITTDTMTISGTTSTGSRTIGQNGEYRLKKVGTTSWLISGTNMT